MISRTALFSVTSFWHVVLAGVAGAACALMGWLAAGLAGIVWFDFFFDPNKSTGLGEGVVAALSLYICAFVFGAVGFVVSLVWLRTRRTTQPKTLVSTPR